MSQPMKQRMDDLKSTIASYMPGSTIRFARQRPAHPPSHLRIGLFGPPGVGKSAFINSTNYATGERWQNIAPEGFACEASKTTARNAFDIAERITIVDNRGMRSLGGPFMAELERHVAGVYGDDVEVQWDKGFFQKVAIALGMAGGANKACELHCAVLVLSALNLSVQATDLKELIETIKRITGEPPIIIMTHRYHKDVRDDVLAMFRSGLQEQRVDYVFEIENYTTADNKYDAEKHLVLLEAIYQCDIVGDRVMKLKESNEGGCTIL